MKMPEYVTMMSLLLALKRLQKIAVSVVDFEQVQDTWLSKTHANKD